MDTGTDLKGQGGEPPRRACTVAEAALYLGISVSAVRAAIYGDRLAARKFGNRTLIEYSELDAFFDALPEDR